MWNNQRAIWGICQGHWSKIADYHWGSCIGLLLTGGSNLDFSPELKWHKVLLQKWAGHHTQQPVVDSPHVRASINRFIVQVLCAAVLVKMLGPNLEGHNGDEQTQVVAGGSVSLPGGIPVHQPLYHGFEQMGFEHCSYCIHTIFISYVISLSHPYHIHPLELHPYHIHIGYIHITCPYHIHVGYIHG